MPAKKRRVTFDSEEIRPSSASSPPPLLLGHFPAIVGIKDVQSIDFHFNSKSILKNAPQEDRPYDSLCNVLIDLPPPPSNEVLSLDVLQQETVFKPPTRFAQFKIDEDKLPLFETESSEDDSEDESEDEYDFRSTTVDDTINEDDITTLEFIPKPKTFESSLLLEQNTDERIFFIKNEDVREANDESLYIEEQIIPSVNQKLFTSSAEMELFASPIKNNYVEDISIVEVTQNAKTSDPSTKEFPDFDGVKDKNDANNTFSYLDSSDITEILSDGLKHTEKPDTLTQAVINRNETHHPPASFTRDTKERSVDQQSRTTSTSEEGDVVAATNKGTETAKEESQKESNLNSEFTQANILTYDEPLITESRTLTSELTRPDSDSSLITDSLPISKFVASFQTNNLSENVSNEVNEFAREGLRNISIETDEQFIELGNQKVVQEESVIFNSTSLSPPFHDITNRENKSNLNSQSLDIIENSDTKLNQSEPRQRRKYKKTHRKHSRFSKSITKEDHPENEKSEADIVALQDQRAAEAREKFKRYLAKMSGKASSEVQNLNCAGEIETLEPHMVSLERIVG